MRTATLCVLPSTARAAKRTKVMGVESASRSSGSAGVWKVTVSSTPAASITLIVAVGVTRRAVVFIAGILTRPLRKR